MPKRRRRQIASKTPPPMPSFAEMMELSYKLERQILAQRRKKYLDNNKGKRDRYKYKSNKLNKEEAIL